MYLNGPIGWMRWIHSIRTNAIDFLESLLSRASRTNAPIGIFKVAKK
jgi:hypothetical protein